MDFIHGRSSVLNCSILFGPGQDFATGLQEENLV
jgi:hypothetical protein